MRTSVETAPSDAASGPTSLADLLAGITADNLHGEWASGQPAGAEQL